MIMLSLLKEVNQTINFLYIDSIYFDIAVIVVGVIISSFLIRWIWGNIKSIMQIRSRGKRERKQLVEEYEQKYGKEKVKQTLGEKRYNKIKNS